MVCADGMIGQMMEPVEFPVEGRGEPLKENDWALTGCEGRKRRIVNSLFLTPEVLYEHNQKLKKKYDLIHEKEKRWELYNGECGYDLLLVAFGTMARICKTAIDEVKREGLRVALFRPITLNPFPLEACRHAMDSMSAAGPVLTVEMSMGQLVQDVKLAAEGSRTIELYGTAGGIVASPDQVAERIRAMLAGQARAAEASASLDTRSLALCERAQADGVPCPETGRDCAVCEEAFHE
jgi:2-oxoglutarate ferredoxin oxidoreductase subunit alpha